MTKKFDPTKLKYKVDISHKISPVDISRLEIAEQKDDREVYIDGKRVEPKAEDLILRLLDDLMCYIIELDQLRRINNENSNK